MHQPSSLLHRARLAKEDPRDAERPSATLPHESLTPDALDEASWRRRRGGAGATGFVVGALLAVVVNRATPAAKVASAEMPTRVEVVQRDDPSADSATAPDANVLHLHDVVIPKAAAAKGDRASASAALMAATPRPAAP